MSIWRLNAHKRNHGTKDIHCDYKGCERVFSSVWRLDDHKRSHGAKVEICETEGCGKGFALRWELKKHKKICTTRTPSARTDVLVTKTVKKKPPTKKTKAPTEAPTKAPTEAPTKAPTKIAEVPATPKLTPAGCLSPHAIMGQFKASTSLEMHTNMFVAMFLRDGFPVRGTVPRPEIPPSDP
jgi:hypothetical protein